MSLVNEPLRKEAIRVLEELVDRLPDDDLRDIIAGDKVPTLLRVDRRLAQHRHKPIDEVYAYLAKMGSGKDVKLLLSSTAPAGVSKPAWIDYVLLTLFGRTYAPPKPPPKAKAARSSKPVRPPWDVAEAIRAFRQMTSESTGKAYLDERAPSNSQLQELARLVGARFNSKTTKDGLKQAILWRCISGPGQIDRAQSD